MMFSKWRMVAGALLMSCFTWAQAASPVLIGIDAEFGHKTSTSAQAVQQGIEIAIAEINKAGGVLGGRPLQLVVRDNRSIAAYQDLRNAGAKAIVLVANEAEGSILVKEMAALPKDQRLPVISHWGITGGEFPKMSGDALDQIDLAVIQTYSFIGQNTPAARRVLQALRERYGVTSAERVMSPVGVAHAYDLTHLLARAVQKAGSTDRRKVRDAMEQLGPYDGLVQRYAQPFTVTRHDALSARNVFFARYTADDRLLPIGAARTSP